MMFKRHTISFAAGYPQTTKVAAKRLGGLFSRDKDRTVVVVNGTSCFTIPTARFQSLRVGACDSGNGSGVFGLIGQTQQGPDEVAAKFGSEEGAKAAFAAVVKASTGIGGSVWGWMFPTMLVILAVFTLTVLSAIAGAGQAGQAVAGTQSSHRVASNAGGGEPTLEELEKLAATGFEFKPKHSAPKVEAPTLACANP